MIDHVSIAVKDYKESLEFYDKTLKTLGYDRIVEIGGYVAGYGKDGKPSFWISTEGRGENGEIGKAKGVHFSFLAPDVDSVYQWYQQCIENGGKDNGAPGIRPEYHPGYYGAFIIDPNGWRIEACLHDYKG